jgi:hypothetical protein
VKARRLKPVPLTNALLASYRAIRQNSPMPAPCSKIKATARLALAVFALAAFLPAQDQMLKVKGGHQLGETSEQFFSEGQEKEALSACAATDFKKVEKIFRAKLKKDCEDLAATRQLAMDGKRTQYHAAGEPAEMREDTFTFDGGRLVKVDLLYALPTLEHNNRGFTFKQIFEGATQAYGPPTNETTKQVQDDYGVPYIAHQELWLTQSAAIQIIEKPGPRGATTLTASTREEFDRTAGKISNPLQ